MTHFKKSHWTPLPKTERLTNSFLHFSLSLCLSRTFAVHPISKFYFCSLGRGEDRGEKNKPLISVKEIINRNQDAEAQGSAFKIFQAYNHSWLCSVWGSHCPAEINSWQPFSSQRSKPCCKIFYSVWLEQNSFVLFC